ncbi:hypothetical protein AB6C47_018115 [Vibrio cyclitrophicus]
MKLRNLFIIVVAAASATNVYADAIQEFALEEEKISLEIASRVEATKEAELARYQSMKDSRTQIFPKYTCKHVEKRLGYNGSNSLTGLVLLPEESENPDIEPFFKKIEFSPFYDKTMGLYGHERGEIPIRSLTETEDEVVFYSKIQDWRSSKRRGEKVVLTKLGDNRFKVQIYYLVKYVANLETVEWESKWDRLYKMDNIGSTSFIYKITEESKKSRESAKCQE